MKYFSSGQVVPLPSMTEPESSLIQRTPTTTLVKYKGNECHTKKNKGVVCNDLQKKSGMTLQELLCSQAFNHVKQKSLTLSLDYNDNVLKYCLLPQYYLCANISHFSGWNGVREQYSTVPLFHRLILWKGGNSISLPMITGNEKVMLKYIRRAYMNRWVELGSQKR